MIKHGYMSWFTDAFEMYSCSLWCVSLYLVPMSCMASCGPMKNIGNVGVPVGCWTCRRRICARRRRTWERRGRGQRLHQEHHQQQRRRAPRYSQRSRANSAQQRACLSTPGPAPGAAKSGRSDRRDHLYVAQTAARPRDWDWESPRRLPGSCTRCGSRSWGAARMSEKSQSPHPPRRGHPQRTEPTCLSLPRVDHLAPP